MFFIFRNAPTSASMINEAPKKLRDCSAVQSPLDSQWSRRIHFETNTHSYAVYATKRTHAEVIFSAQKALTISTNFPSTPRRKLVAASR
ncbi:hypothetical protein ARMSODRAFT_560449 [Armillaria solidipes]|uniref:Uncharacterized protein n=1 Tax=Armillaria solidipes TaxID=1076256 RepID=A0A2H3AVH1_9AGAR|nr:hypothetical protein ARMSODRAFT_560449 [Armillaria solidipes]